ncbi:MAG: hypothetical protein ACOCVC_01795, partial [Spirochaeta sp.]
DGEETDEDEDTTEEPVDTAPSVQTQPVSPSPDPDSPPAPDDSDGLLDGALEFLGGYMNMEIGSITMGGETYGKVILQPEFELGKFGVGLYLPVIYRDNLFNPSTWYQPEGNNEWSFGTDADFSDEQDETLLRIQDFWNDVWLKIRYVRWGEQRDPFFITLGNINSMTLGHGLLMNRYANDKDFPQVRRIGMNLGIDPGRAGVQVIVNDLANPEIFGGRLFYRPAHPASRIALGVSAASDINPAADIAPDEEVPLTGTAIEAGPSFLNFAVDIDIPVIENDLFSIIIFGDAGGFIPYLRNSPADSGLSAGWQPQTFYDDNDGKFGFEDFQNYGMASGLFGSILILDYRLEYRNYHGIFEPFYNATYERFRGQKAMEVMDYLLNPDAARFDRRTHGIYGEAHFGIINDAIQLQLGYMWPWNTAADFESDDYVNASLSIEEELLPLGISGGISYTRHGFVQSIANESSASLFDAKTTLEGEIIYPIAAGMNIALTVGTSAKRNSSGDLVYDADGDLESEFSLGIETRIGY